MILNDDHNLINVTREQLLRDVQSQVTPKRFEHILRVEQTALELARVHQLPLSEDSISIVALIHDIAKDMRYDDMEALALAYWPNDALRGVSDNILHGLAAAQILRTVYQCESESMLRAVAAHTIGWFDMDDLAKLLYVADYIEPGRQFDAVVEARDIAYRSLDEAAWYEMQHTLTYLIQHKKVLFTGTIDIYNAWCQRITNETN